MILIFWFDGIYMFVVIFYYVDGMFNWDVLVEVIEFLIFYGVYGMIFGGFIGENYV